MKLHCLIVVDNAAINEVLSCAYNGFLKCDIKPGEYVMPIGAGPIGIMYAKLALMAGAGKVFMNNLSAERLDACRQIDSRIITYHGDNLEKFAYENTDEGLGVCITACLSPEVKQATPGLMDYGGRINFFGGLPKDKEIV